MYGEDAMSDTSFYTDRQFLTTVAYGNQAHLAARQDIYRYQQPSIDLYSWTLDQVRWSGDERVIDLGCGNGAYLRRLAQRIGRRGRVLGLDLSRGMLADVVRGWDAALPRPHLVVADAQALPLPGASCNVALAMHMLYHVPDIALAVRELRRVLRPGGVLLAVTGSARHLRELGDAYHAALSAVAGQPITTHFRFSPRFSMETGAAFFQTAFEHIEQHDVMSTLVIPDMAAVRRYMDSARAGLERMLPAGVAGKPSWPSLNGS
jgi:ubiquinone/menaquinone biosynthesis C-methylase UbiE